MTLGVLIVISALSFLWLRMAEDTVAVAPADLPRLAMSGLCGYALFRLLTNLGLGHGSVFSSTVLLATTPLWASLLAVTIGGERISPKQWFGQALAFAGVVVFSGGAILDIARLRRGPGLGDVLFVASAICWAAYGVINKSLLERYSALRVTSWSTLLGIAFLLPFTISPLLSQDWGAVAPSTWWALAYNALIPTLIAHPVWNWSIRRRGASAVTPYMNLVPVFGGLFAWVLLGEVPAPQRIFGAILVLLGLFLARRT